MANYKKLTDVEVMEEVSENSMALVNENGVLKQVPCGAGFGGGGVATAIIKKDGYDNALAGVASAEILDEVTFTCANMTFDEAYQIIMSGEPLGALIMAYYDGTTFAIEHAMSVVAMTVSTYISSAPAEPQIAFEFPSATLIWTASSGITQS